MNKLSWGSNDWRRSTLDVCKIKTNVNDDNFEASCENYCHVLKEVLKALRVFNAVKLAIGKA